MRSPILLVATLSLAACGAVPPSRYDAPSWRTGWGDSHATQPGEVYPARFPRLSKDAWHRREAELQATSGPWNITLASSGFLARAEHPAENGNDLSARELDDAQRFIDLHLALMGLARQTPLKKWDDGLYYLSPIDDPRFGISVLHKGTSVAISGQLWPGVTIRSSARRAPSEALRPWLGTRIISGDHVLNPPCDRVSSGVNDCTPPSDPAPVTVDPDIAQYVIHGRVVGDWIEVREMLALALPPNPKAMDVGVALPPAAQDARTGEALDVVPLESGMCEDEGACVSWGHIRTERNVFLWHWVSLERLQSEVVFRPPPNFE
jgi:hypothetical protein